MAEQRQPFRFRIPWLPGASVPARAPTEPTLRPVTEAPVAEAPVAAERIPFQPIIRPPFRPAGISQEPPPPPSPKVPSPPRETPQPPSSPRAAPEFLPQRPTSQPEVVFQSDTVVPPPVPPRPEVPPAVVSQSQSTSGASPETNIKSEVPELTPLPSVSETQSSIEKQEKPVASASLSDPVKADQPKVLQSTSGASPETNIKSEVPELTPLPSVSEPQSSIEKQEKPVASASLSDPVKVDQPKVLPSAPSEISSLTSVSQPSPDLQPRETSLPEPVERLAADKSPTKPSASALGPNQAKADPPKPSSLELKALSPHLSENSSPATAAEPSRESPPKEMSLPQQFVQHVVDEKPAKPVDSTSVPNPAAANPPEPTPLVPKALASASQDSASFGPISQPSGDSQGPFNGIISKLQEYKRVEAVDKEEAPIEAAGSVANSGKTKEKGTTHPLAMPPVPEKQSKGLSPSASSSIEPRRSKQMKFVPKKRVAKASSDQSNTHRLDSHPRPAAVRGVGSSSSSFSSFQKEIKDDVSKLVHSITSGKVNTSSILESVDVITLSGENMGATMHLTSGSDERKEHIHIRRNYRSNPDESVESKTDAEEEEGEVEGAEGEDESEKSAFLNSNVQGVNNSLVLDSSVSEGSPGVHFELALNAEPQLGLRSETFKNEFSVTPTEKHTYKPTMRRRCLRGLFMESSGDSSSDDADNPNKPRRHGCRYGYGWKNEEKHVDVA